MGETKTKPTEVEPSAFLDSVEPLSKREDSKVLDALLRRVTGEEPRMWGPTIVGYGSYHYRYASGHEGVAPRRGFSPRKAKHSLYIMDYGSEEEEAAFAPLLSKLGKHARGTACLYVNKLVDIDLAVLEEMAQLGWRRSLERWPGG